MTREYCNYIVYEDGKVYSNKTKKFLKGEITKHGYLQYTLSIDKKSVRIKAHRLVSILFLEKVNGKDIVNHIDGNKLNNHYTNLEWCDYYYNNKHARDNGLNNISESNSKRWEDKDFREKMSKKISENKKDIYKGSKNPNFRYRIIHNNEELTRQELKELLNRSQSNIDSLIKKCANGEFVKIFEDNDIKIYDTKKSQQTIERILYDNAI